MAVSINRQVRAFNAEVVKKIWLEDALGNIIHLRRGLAGDIALTEPLATSVRASVDGKPVASLLGDLTVGSISIPLHGSALTDVEDTGDPTLREILTRTNGGAAWVPFTGVAGTDPDGDTFVYQATPRIKMWKICIESAYARGGNTSATKNELVTAYVEIPNPPINIANVGGVSTYTLAGEIPREGLVTITTV